MKETMKEFITKDFYLSGFLIYKGVKFLDMEREQGYTVFRFEDNQQTQALTSQYYLSKTLVDPAAYGLTIRQLKGAMHNTSISTQNQLNNNEKNNSQGTK